MTANAGAAALESVDTVYVNGQLTASYERSAGYTAPHPDEYTHYSMGVATFRGDNFRRNAAFGFPDVQNESLSVRWQFPLGFLRTEDNGTLYGVGWTGQPAIVKWTKEVREGMNLFEEKRACA